RVPVGRAGQDRGRLLHARRLVREIGRLTGGAPQRAGSGGDSTLRTCTTSPAIAAAATIAGLMSSVRPVGLPCRPLKLRLDDEAHTSAPCSLSGFMPRHIEQPAPRHSKPASRKI